MKKVYEWLEEEYEITKEQFKFLTKEEKRFFVSQYLEFEERG